MMKPVNFPESNVVYAKDQDEYLDLPAYIDTEGIAISCWKLTLWERLCLLITGRLWLKQLTFNSPLQPQCPQIKTPFTTRLPKETSKVVTRVKMEPDAPLLHTPKATPLLLIIMLITGCAWLETIEHSLGYSGGYQFEQGDKEDSGVASLRYVAQAPIKESGFNAGLTSEFNFAYTEDAIDDHNYDLREFGLSPLLRISYDTPMLSPFFEIGPTFRWGEADSDAANFEEIQVDVRFGVDVWSGWSIYYRGTNTDYGIDVATSGSIGGINKRISDYGDDDHGGNGNGEPLPPPGGGGMDRVNTWTNTFGISKLIRF